MTSRNWDPGARPAGYAADSIVMGRGEGVCDVVIRDDYASPRHCRITRYFPKTGDGACRLYVEDLGSTNGTWINGRRIYAPTELLIGDRLRIGHRERILPPHAFWKEP